MVGTINALNIDAFPGSPRALIRNTRSSAT
jgi:hypothetical protein